MIVTDKTKVRVLAVLFDSRGVPIMLTGPELSRKARMFGGRLYPTLRRLLRDEMVHSEWYQPDPSKSSLRRYGITPEGREFLIEYTRQRVTR